MLNINSLQGLRERACTFWKAKGCERRVDIHLFLVCLFTLELNTEPSRTTGGCMSSVRLFVKQICPKVDNFFHMIVAFTPYVLITRMSAVSETGEFVTSVWQVSLRTADLPSTRTSVIIFRAPHSELQTTRISHCYVWVFENNIKYVLKGGGNGKGEFLRVLSAGKLVFSWKNKVLYSRHNWRRPVFGLMKNFLVGRTDIL